MLAFDPEPRQNPRRRVGQPGELFAVDYFAAQHLALEVSRIGRSSPRGLAHERPLRFGQVRRLAQGVGERQAQIAIAARGGGSALDVSQATPFRS